MSRYIHRFRRTWKRNGVGCAHGLSATCTCTRGSRKVDRTLGIKSCDAQSTMVLSISTTWIVRTEEDAVTSINVWDHGLTTSTPSPSFFFTQKTRRMVVALAMAITDSSAAPPIDPLRILFASQHPVLNSISRRMAKPRI